MGLSNPPRDSPPFNTSSTLQIKVHTLNSQGFLVTHKDGALRWRPNSSSISHGPKPEVQRQPPWVLVTGHHWPTFTVPPEFPFSNCKMGNANISSSIPICAVTMPTHSDPSSDRSTRANHVCYFYDFIPNKGWFHFQQAHYIGKFSLVTVRQKYRGRFFFFP